MRFLNSTDMQKSNGQIDEEYIKNFNLKKT